jgi:hypothetical protein
MRRPFRRPGSGLPTKYRCVRVAPAVGRDGTPGRRRRLADAGCRPRARRAEAQRGYRRPRGAGLRAAPVRVYDDGAIGSFVRGADVSTQCPVVIRPYLLSVGNETPLLLPSWPFCGTDKYRFNHIFISINLYIYIYTHIYIYIYRAGMHGGDLVCNSWRPLASSPDPGSNNK